MEEIKISQLPEATQVNENDYLTIVQEGTNKKIKASNTNLGGGTEIYIGDEEDAPETAKLVIDEEGTEFSDSEVIDSLEGNERNLAPSVRAVNAKFQKTVLWTNPNPSAGFAEQQVQLSSSDYNYLEIWSYNGTSMNESIYIKIPKAQNGRIFYFVGEDSGGYLGFRYRMIKYVNDTTLLFKGAYQKFTNEQTISPHDGWCVPYKIIGCK